MAWGLFPILFASHGLTLTQVGLLGALYPAFWGIAQLGTGALSDRIGRKWLISTGMLVQAGALALVAGSTSYGPWIVAAVLLGLGTAMVYPTLLAVVGDVAHPIWRGRAVGVYRLWRDSGFAVGALLAGLIADLWGLTTAIWVVAALTAGSGLVVAARMYETHSRSAPAADRRVEIQRLDGRRQPLGGRFPGPGTDGHGHTPHWTCDESRRARACASVLRPTLMGRRVRAVRDSGRRYAARSRRSREARTRGVLDRP